MSGKEYTCPLRMSDGRSMTDYRPKCIVNYELMETMDKKKLLRVVMNLECIYKKMLMKL